MSDIPPNDEILSLLDQINHEQAPADSPDPSTGL
jgi:hypothetical protein